MGKQNPGYIVDLGNAPRALVGTISAQSTSSSPSALVAAGAAGIYNDITLLILTNASAVPTVVSISDGTVSYPFSINANGGGVFPFWTPLPATSPATEWTISNSAGATIYCVGTYIMNQD